ncbi:melatonin receptor type 1B-A [Nematostella vectensis]|uniref:melatonin receptor type 1B-A n=1 Tax=Nematostella vectensis TaxID=45351 RepID=UPI00139055B2|nr:melatonin receptor type 1B-A [Nematostella vectensis]
MLPIPPPSDGVLAIEVLTLLIINAIAFGGNLLVCVASYRNPRLRTTTNLYVIALAISDILAASITMPLTLAAIVTGRWSFGVVACNVQGFFVHFLIYASMHTMALTAINRYFRIVKPQKYKRIFQKRRATTLLVLVWMTVGVVVGLPPICGWARFDFRPGKSLYMCILYFETKAGEVTFLLTILVFYVLLSLIVMATSYVHVSRTIKEHNMQVFSSLRRVSGISVEEIRITKTLFVLVLAFTVCWIPVYTVVSIIRSGLGDLTNAGSVFASLVIFLTSAINPFAYAFRSQSFREEFQRILTCHCRPILPDRQLSGISMDRFNVSDSGITRSRYGERGDAKTSINSKTSGESMGGACHVITDNPAFVPSPGEE